MRASPLCRCLRALVHRRGLLAAGAAAAVACSRAAPPPPPPAVAVTVAVARRGPAPDILTANGQVEPIETARVAAQVSGLVTDVTFREGDMVWQGQVLFRIDPRPYAAALAQARATLARDEAQAANATREADRYEVLVRQDYVTKADADAQVAAAKAAVATVSADHAAVAKAEFDLGNTVIRAPITGRTGSVLVRRGNLVDPTATQPLVVINQIAPIRVRFNVPASVFREVLSGYYSRALPVRVGTDAQGTLAFVDNAVDTTTGTVQLKAQFDNMNGRLWPGQFVTVDLQLSVQPDALLVPSKAVQTGQRGSYVYVVQRDGRAASRPVVVGRIVGAAVVVQSGLAEGERVITEGQSRLAANARVRIAGEDSTVRVATASVDTTKGEAP